MPTFTVAGPEFLRALGAAVERGRGLTADDERDQALVVVINRALAAAFWPDVDPLGQCVRFGNVGAPCSTIVGIAENVLSYDRADTRQPQIYLLPSHPAVAGVRPRALFVRARGDAASLVPAVRQVVQSLRPDMPFIAITTLAERVRAAAPTLASGIDDVHPLRHHRARHRRGRPLQRDGVRGLAAEPRDRDPDGARRVRVARRRAGVPARRRHRRRRSSPGLLLAWLLSNQIAGLLYQTSPTDAFVFVTVAAVLAVAGVVAAIVPARRSTFVDPLIVLKSE